MVFCTMSEGWMSKVMQHHQEVLISTIACNKLLGQETLHKVFFPMYHYKNFQGYIKLKEFHSENSYTHDLDSTTYISLLKHIPIHASL